MSYSEALEAAGATVVAYQEFGSYQGDWYASVVYNGTPQWVHGSYGSCSGCDSFQAEFDYFTPGCEEHRYDRELSKGCKECAEATEVHQRKLAAFGESYLTSGTMTQEEAEKEAGSRYYWDGEAIEMVKFLQDNAIPKVPFTLQINDRS